MSGSELATRGDQGHARPPAQTGGMARVGMQIDEVWQIAERIAASRLFPVQNANEAFALMMLSHAEGLHPMQALRRYHIIEGRPAMRSDAIQAEFQARGGAIEIVRADAEEARARFSHPKLQPTPFEVAVTLTEFKALGVCNGKEGLKKNWKQSPGDMLWARLVTKTIRKIYPGIVAGIYSTDEIEDMAAADTPEAVTVQIQQDYNAAVAAEQGPVYGGPKGIDRRDYLAVISDAHSQLARDLQGSSQAPPTLNEMHGAMMSRAVMAGRDDGSGPKKAAAVIQRLSAIYKSDPAFVRGELNAFCHTRVDLAAPQDSPQAEDVPDVEPAEDDALDSLFPSHREPGEEG